MAETRKEAELVSLPIDVEDPSVLQLNPRLMENLGLFRGDICSVKCVGGVDPDRRTILVVLSNEELSMGEVALSQDALENAGGLEFGNPLLVSCVEEPPPFAKAAQVLPFSNDLEGIKVEDIFDNFLRPFFVEAYRPVQIGDEFRISGQESRIVRFRVTGVENPPLGIVAPETVIYSEGMVEPKVVNIKPARK